MVTAFRGGGEGTEMANPAGLEAPQTCRGSGCGPNFIANSRVHAETERLNASRSRRDDTRLPPYSRRRTWRSEEHTSELQSLMRISYAVFCLTQKKNTHNNTK